ARWAAGHRTCFSRTCTHASSAMVCRRRTRTGGTGRDPGSSRTLGGPTKFAMLGWTRSRPASRLDRNVGLSPYSALRTRSMSDSLIDALTHSDERHVVQATLVSASGSSSKKIGAKMLVGASGKLLGGVTIGGCVDAQVIEAGDDMISRGGCRL